MALIELRRVRILVRSLNETIAGTHVCYCQLYCSEVYHTASASHHNAILEVSGSMKVYILLDYRAKCAETVDGQY